EELLAARPALANHPDCALELIYTEFLLRTEVGPPPSVDDWYARFPQWADRLRRMFQIHSQLAREAPTVHGRTPPVPHDAPPAALPAAPEGYELLDPLGRGGMGVVYRARQIRLNPLVALQLPRPHRSLHPEAVGRYRREALAASALNHPHICTIYDRGEHDGQPFIVMELIEGTTLQVLAGRPLGPEALGRLVGQVAD